MSQEIWKSKISGRIKVFLWYLKRGVVLTKDNFAKHNWHGDKNCCFCHLPETVHHLFFECSYARCLWRAVQVSFGINIPANKDELFSQWLRPNGPKTNTLLLVAAAALIWAIWLTRNEVIFEKARPKTFLQVLFRGTHWLHQWASLQRQDEHKDMLVQACRHLEVSAL